MANNLQVVASLLRLRRKSLEPESAGAAALEAALTRLEMVSRVHRRLHDPASVDQPVEQYLGALCRELISASDTPGIELSVQADPIQLSLDALMSVSQIVAELVTNSLKHAFRSRSAGTLTVNFRVNHGSYVLSVADDGPGLPPDFRRSKSDSLGQGILQSLATQIRGQISYTSGPGAALEESDRREPTSQPNHKVSSGGPKTMAARS